MASFVTADPNCEPLISVLLPVHNAAHYVREAIDSILVQTFRDFELLAIDDGSTDDTREVLEEFAARDSRIRLVIRKQRGLVATLNEGIQLAQGQWIARMDADDIARPNRFGVQLQQLTHVQADFCGGAIECFGEWVAVYRYPLSHLACEGRMLFGVPFAHPAVIGKRSAFLAVGYDSCATHAEDYDFWQRAWAAGYRFTNVPDIVLRYRTHSGQVSSSNRPQQRDGTTMVRRRHWQAIFPDMSMRETERIDNLISYGRGRISWIMPFLYQLTLRYTNKVHCVLWDDMFVVFCRAAATDTSCGWNWLKLLFSGQQTSKMMIRNLLRFVPILGLSILRLNAHSTAFNSLQRFRAKSMARLRRNNN